ncbi:unnamed protein product [Tenebrio molitor]|nr:unnamed protein product [Tenebrio molitor]
MDQKFTNLRISGRTNITSTKAIMNFDDLTLTIRMVNPEIRYLADYQVKGNMFLLPIDASGLLTTKGYNILYTLIFKFEEYIKDGVRYLRVISSKIAMEPESMTYYLENLFEDKELNDAYSRAVTKRSKEIFGLQQLVYGNSYAQSYNDVFNNLLRKVPLTELFEGV